jgi:membrane-associated protease RseP (regulator of RpoE activity)
MASTVFRPGDRPLFHLGLFLLTIGTTFAGYLVMFLWTAPRAQQIADSLTFALCLVAILGSHEMGHYVLARYHRVDTSLPYFIPSPPLITLGTLGAVIRLRGRIPHRNALVDIGAAGPLAGLVVALPIVIYGVATAQVVDSPVPPLPFPRPFSAWSVAGTMFDALGGWLTGAPRPEPVPLRGTILFGDNLLTKILQIALFGPLPEGKDLEVGPAFIAGWFGMLVTTLNMFPIGQLDGGHLTRALFGERAVAIGKVAALFLLALVVFWSLSWLVWLLIATKVVGYRHPPVIDEASPLGRGRVWICALAFLGLVLCLMPAPLTQVTFP